MAYNLAAISMKNEQQVRKEFAFYFLDLKAKMAADGASVEKHAEWTQFINHRMEEGGVPKEAASWKCPRSLEAELKI